MYRGLRREESAHGVHGECFEGLGDPIAFHLLAFCRLVRGGECVRVLMRVYA